MGADEAASQSSDGENEGTGDTDETKGSTSSQDTSSESTSASGSKSPSETSGQDTGEDESEPLDMNFRFDIGVPDAGDIPDNNRCTPTEPIVPAIDCDEIGVILEAPYDEEYSCLSVGQIPGVPTNYGGLTLHPTESDRLLVGGHSNEANGSIFSVGIARDEKCHVIGFLDVETKHYSAGEYNDGGVTFHPDSGVFFLARWPVNELGQVKPGSLVTDRIIDTAAMGIPRALAALFFVPEGFPAAGTLKLVAWPNGEWYDTAISPDGNGTYNLDSINHLLDLPGGPEGFVYVAAGNPQFEKDTLLVSEWTANFVSAFDIDDNADPVLETRRDFISGLKGAEGAFIDPLSGDFMFTTWGKSDELIAVQGFRPTVIIE